MNVITALSDYIMDNAAMNMPAKKALFSITRTAAYLCRKAGVRVVLILFYATAASAATQPNLGATVIQGSGVYDAIELFDLYKNYMGQPVTARTAPAIAEAVRAKYAEDGFARPGYKVLDSGMKSGIVRISVVELTISRLEFSGSAGPYEQKVREMANALSSDSAIRPANIRDVLSRVRRLPGLTVAVDTRADGGGNGGVVLGLDSTYKPLEGYLKLSNRGTREIGRNLAFAQGIANGLFGREDSVGIYAATSEKSDRYKSGGVFGTTVLGQHGTSARLLAGISALRLDQGTATETQDRTLLKLRVTQPLWQEASHKLSLWGEFAIENTDVGLDEFVLQEDRLRSLDIGSSLTFGESGVQYYTSVELEQGLSGLGAELNTPVAASDPRRADFTIVRIRMVRLARLRTSWSLRWDMYGQYSPHILPSTKRFKVGGDRIGRGFEAAAISGDRGIGNKIKLNRQLDDFADWRQHTGVYGFYDLGTTWRELSGLRESAASAGIGVSFHADWLSGHIELAKPLTHADEDGNKEAKIFGELAMRF